MKTSSKENEKSLLELEVAKVVSEVTAEGNSTSVKNHSCVTDVSKLPPINERIFSDMSI